ncbi:hypothetical protein AB0B50_16260 [Streptomyces sp. NPDC041068]|uniref:hypothetical protein n=1 Tax=Streptomyces sp. NPDC041068 TaxID=3155130 RepID=UPI0033D15A88
MDPKKIKRRLREIAADPGQPGARAEVQRLRGSLRRARDTTARPERRIVPDEVDQDAEAIKTWPPELRARLGSYALTRVILPWGRD